MCWDNCKQLLSMRNSNAQMDKWSNGKMQAGKDN